MSLSPLPKEMLDPVSVYRHKFEGVFDMHQIKTGSPEDFPGFMEQLRTNRYFAMDFWEIAQSSNGRGNLSPEKILETVMQCVGGPGIQETDPEILEFQKELNVHLVPEAEIVGPVETTQSPAQTDADSAQGGLPPETEKAPVVDEPAYTLGSTIASEEVPDADAYVALRHVDDALSRLEINSNALKLQLNDIDSRMSRIEPHLEDLSSRAAPSAGLEGTTGNSRKSRREHSSPGAAPVGGQAAEKGAVPKPSAAAPRRAWFERWGAVLGVATMLLLLAVWLWVLRHRSFSQGVNRAQAASATGVASLATGAPPPTTSVAEPGPGPKLAAVPTDNASKETQRKLPGESQAAVSAPAERTSKLSPERASDLPGQRPSNANSALRERTPAEPTVFNADAAVVGDTPDAQTDSSPEADLGSGSLHVASLRTRDKTRAGGWKQGISVSSGVMASNLIDSEPPSYPRLAKLTHIQGQVVLQVFISKDGTVDHINAVKGHRLLRGAAKNAVKHWRYRPYLVNGRPVEVATIVTVDFNLDKK
jgi:TonB family protein